MRFLSACSIVFLIILSCSNAFASETPPNNNGGTGVTPNSAVISDEEYLAMTPEQREAYKRGRREQNAIQAQALSEYNDADFEASIENSRSHRRCGRIFNCLWTVGDGTSVAAGVTVPLVVTYLGVTMNVWVVFGLGVLAAATHLAGRADDWFNAQANVEVARAEDIAEANARAILHLEELDRINQQVEENIELALQGIMNTPNLARDDALRLADTVVRGHLNMWPSATGRARMQRQIETAIAAIIARGPAGRNDALNVCRDIVRGILRPPPVDPMQPPVEVGTAVGGRNEVALTRLRALHEDPSLDVEAFDRRRPPPGYTRVKYVLKPKNAKKKEKEKEDANDGDVVLEMTQIGDNETGAGGSNNNRDYKPFSDGDNSNL